MNASMRIQRPLAVALLAILSVGAMAPFAEAGNRHRRYRGHYVERRVVVRPVYRSVRVYPHARYTVWRSGHGPVIAGFLGGLFLGATIANAAPDGFYYWDPYCHRGFASLELYDAHCRRHAHQRVIEVVEGPDGCDPADVRGSDWDGDQDWDDEDDR